MLIGEGQRLDHHWPISSQHRVYRNSVDWQVQDSRLVLPPVHLLLASVNVTLQSAPSTLLIIPLLVDTVTMLDMAVQTGHYTFSTYGYEYQVCGAVFFSGDICSASAHLRGCYLQLYSFICFRDIACKVNLSLICRNSGMRWTVLLMVSDCTLSLLLLLLDVCSYCYLVTCNFYLNNAGTCSSSPVLNVPHQFLPVYH